MRRQWALSGILIVCVDVHMGLDPLPEADLAVGQRVSWPLAWFGE